MGFFSWKTQDTNRSIANKYSSEPTFTVYMVNPLTGEQFEEADYEGYGEFGGKDYYELLAEINGKSTRDEGIELQFEGNPNGEPIKYPILVEDYHNWEKYIGQQPEDCEYQGYFYPEDDNDEWETDEDENPWGEEPDMEDEEMEENIFESLTRVLNKVLKEDIKKPTVADMKEFLIRAIEQLPDSEFKLNEYSPNEDSFSFIDFNIRLGKQKNVQLFVRKDNDNYELNF